LSESSAEGNGKMENCVTDMYEQAELAFVAKPTAGRGHFQLLLNENWSICEKI
jgi:hypothetical protein